MSYAGTNGKQGSFLVQSRVEGDGGHDQPPCYRPRCWETMDCEKNDGYDQKKRLNYCAHCDNYIC